MFLLYLSLSRARALGGQAAVLVCAVRVVASGEFALGGQATVRCVWCFTSQSRVANRSHIGFAPPIYKVGVK